MENVDAKKERPQGEKQLYSAQRLGSEAEKDKIAPGLEKKLPTPIWINQAVLRKLCSLISPAHLL